MVKKSVIALVAAIIIAVGMLPNERVSAQDPANYTWEYGATNFYTDDAILAYQFTGLDSATDYVWQWQGLNFDGSVAQAIGQPKFFSGGTGVIVQWKGEDGDFDYGAANQDREDNTVSLIGERTWRGPARVIDNQGNILGTHFMWPGCSDALSNSCGLGVAAPDWNVTGTANNSLTNRFGVGMDFNLHDENVDGWFHEVDRPGAVTTPVGEWTLLHYRISAAPGFDELRFYNLNSSTILLNLELQDFIDYNTDVNNALLTPWHVTESFIVLNTAGTALRFINQVQEIASFKSPGAGDNPFIALFQKGAYDYERTSSIGVNVADGESVWLVTDGGLEWNVTTGQQIVVELGRLNVELETLTETVWDSGFNDHIVVDSEVGTLDTDDYVYLRRRPFNFQVGGVETEGAVVTWSILPTMSNMSTATLSERHFEATYTYDIDALQLTDRVEGTLIGYGLNTTLGRSLALIIILVVAMVVAASFGAAGLIPFGLIYIAGGGIWMALGLSDPLTLLLFSITAILILYMMFQSRKKQGAGEF